MRELLEDKPLSWTTAVALAVALQAVPIVYLITTFVSGSDSWPFATAAALLSCVVATGLMLHFSLNPDQLRSAYTEAALNVASDTLSDLLHGLTPEAAKRVCERLLAETSAMAIAITDTEHVLGYVGEYEADFPPGSRIHTEATREVLRTGELRSFTTSMRVHGARDPRIIPAGIVGPLVVSGKPVGTLKFYYHNARKLNRTQYALVKGFSELLSTQLAIHELERQTELTAHAEIKALQAQINPHFLFNTLNTIAAFTRIDPLRARELLREFSSFYRATLENSGSLIPVTREIAQTKRYLVFEKARFGDDRIKDSFEIEAGMEDMQVPAFIIQPLVENAVRHAMRDEGPLKIEVSVRSDGPDAAFIEVSDDGVGMEPEQAERLFDELEAAAPAPDPTEHTAHGEKGAGVALRNIAERVRHFYGPESYVTVLSEPNKGTSFVLRLDLREEPSSQK